MLCLGRGRRIQNLGFSLALMGWVAFATQSAQAALTPIDGGSYGPLLEASYAVASAENFSAPFLPEAYKPELVEEFNDIQGVLGTEAYLVVVNKDEAPAEVAEAAACVIAPDACLAPALQASLAALGTLTQPESEEAGFRPSLIDTDVNALTVRFPDGERTVVLVLIPEFGRFTNERADAAIMGYARAVAELQSAAASGVPSWWVDGLARYLGTRLLAYTRVGSKMPDHLRAANSTLDWRIGTGSQLEFTAEFLPEINYAAVHRLVFEFGAHAVLTEFPARLRRVADWQIAFQNQFGESSDAFAQRAINLIKADADQNALIDHEDLQYAFLKENPGSEPTARNLFQISRFQTLGAIPLQTIDGCTPYLGTSAHELGDFNGDGYQDVVFAIDESAPSHSQTGGPDCDIPTTVVAVYGAAPEETPVLSLLDQEAWGERDIAVADINGDGFDDILVVGAKHVAGRSAARLYLGGAAGATNTTSTILNQTEFDLENVDSEFVTPGDIDNDGFPEFMIFAMDSRGFTPFPVPVVFDCSPQCVARHPAGYDASTYDQTDVVVYNGALLDLDEDGDIDILINIEDHDGATQQPSLYPTRYLHGAFYNDAGTFRLSSPPEMVDLGFRLDSNTLRPQPNLDEDPNDARVLPLNATHYWETEVTDLNNDGKQELITLENNQFHVSNSRFLVSVYEHSLVTRQLGLSADQPEDTGLTHNQNFQFVDVDADGDLDILSTTKPFPNFGNTIFLHENLNPGWRLSAKGYGSFMQDNNCNRIFAPDLDGDGDFDVITMCGGGERERQIYFARNLKQENLAPADRDSDGVLDADDAFPLDAFEQLDSDGDGLGNNTDADDDGDALSDEEELAMGTDPLLADSDGDGLDDGVEVERGLDPVLAGLGQARPGPNVPLALQVAGASFTLPSGGLGAVPSSAAAAALNITVVNPSAPGFITAWPCGLPRPLASNINFEAGSTIPNGVIASLGSDGAACLYSSVETDIVVDLAGWFDAEAYQGATPVRLVDTRDGTGAPLGLTNSAAPIQVPVASLPVTSALGAATAIPVDVGAVALNVTAVEPTDPGYITVWPCEAGRPNASNLNFMPGDIIANGVIAPAGSSGVVCAFSSAPTHMIVDLAGWFPGDTFTGMTPTRLLDTRDGGGAKVPTGGVVEVETRRPGLATSSDAAALSLNVTVTEAEGPGYLTVWPCDVDRPNASNLNYVAGQTIANNVMTTIGASGKVCAFASAPTHVIVDIAGWVNGSGEKTTFSGVKPTRVGDTRTGQWLGSSTRDTDRDGVSDAEDIAPLDSSVGKGR